MTNRKPEYNRQVGINPEYGKRFSECMKNPENDYDDCMVKCEHLIEY